MTNAIDPEGYYGGWSDRVGRSGRLGGSGVSGNSRFP